MIMIFGALVENDDISMRFFFNFFKILIFWVVSGVKGQKIVQNDKKNSVSLHTSGTIHQIIVIFGTHV